MRKKHCIECECDDKVRIAKYECLMCGSGACEKCYKNLGGECSQCIPQLVKIKK